MATGKGEYFFVVCSGRVFIAFKKDKIMFTAQAFFPSLDLEVIHAPVLFQTLICLPQSQVFFEDLQAEGWSDFKLSSWLDVLNRSDKKQEYFRNEMERISGLSLFVDRTTQGWLFFAVSISQKPIFFSAPEEERAVPLLALHHDKKDAFLFFLKEGQAVYLHDQDGMGLVCFVDTGVFACFCVSSKTSSFGDVEPLFCNELDGYLAELREEDPDLVEWLEEDLSVGGDWSLVTVLGAAMRLRFPEKGGAAKALVQRLLKETPIKPHLSVCWAKTWSPAQRKNIEGLFLVKLGILYSEFKDYALHISEDFAEDKFSVRVVYKLLLRRDELDSVALLLRVHGDLKDELVKKLRLIDELGKSMVYDFPQSTFLTNSARLKRILSSHPRAWWAFPAAEQILCS